jgi:hypothetical protein
VRERLRYEDPEWVLAYLKHIIKTKVLSVWNIVELFWLHVDNHLLSALVKLEVCRFSRYFLPFLSQDRAVVRLMLKATYAATIIHCSTFFLPFSLTAFHE